ncbi:Cytochrome c oxidase assembly protein cox15 [Orbilia oligospora]|uniref:Cytochrome c oxidase assembly protein cox15 n=1 Tax=Orbilia oligospora TaxID=2813651 RepID=A0A6G1MDM9_ORBOL|nr:Cytochrome c oxidase assembly protein cox15 [Orbilia oligospora]KAF3226396.1 Cytochrome c oxidase assembly protein cox15 [Orbilia oligospora]KAF3252569.1 Cytochrome c oxidase assembly protein cox15 [Orbilia oligospora]
MASATISSAVRARLLSAPALTCRQCQRIRLTPTLRTPLHSAQYSTSRTSSKLQSILLKSSKSGTILLSKTKSSVLESIGTVKSAYRRLATSAVESNAAATATTKTKSSSFPDTSEKVVGYWLLGSAGLVFGIVVLGGLTRLTESGLSITEWKPVTGSLPPLSDADWESEFSKYRNSPEFRILNPTMNLEEYKFIYYMEWTHRLLGRVIGLSFVLPAIYFVARRKVSKSMALKLGGIALGIGFQGFIGWWMVKSGLQDDLFQKPGSHPRVSQYRLTAHLGAAFAVYSAMLYTGVSVLRENRLLKDPKKAVELLAKRRIGALVPLRIFVGFVSLLIFTTAMSGALVAGLDAGLVYNEFPMMGTGLAPPVSELLDPFYSREPPPHNDLVWRNMLENPTTVQLDHRILATTSFFTVLALWAYGGRLRRAKVLTPEAKKGILGLVHLVSMQVALGIATLIYFVPHSLASLHQANSLALLTGCLVLGSRVWVPRALLKVAEKRVALMGRSTKAAGKKVEKSDIAT